MANPSLQIGNGKFAIKENDLLGYSSSGTRFFPIPITMTRATLGTRVNPSGLVENVELLGSELITNGDFSSSDLSSFTVIFATQEIVSQELKTTLNTSNGYGFTRVFFTAEIGKSYRILVDAKQGTSDGTQIKTQSGLTLTQSSSTTGDWSFEGIGVATSTSCEFRLQVNGSDGDFGFFDNVSVKEVTRDGLARVDYTDSTGSLLVEPQRTNLITYSEDFSEWNLQGSGTGSTPIITSNNTISPDGIQNADKIVFNKGAGVSASDLSVISSDSFTTQSNIASFYIKADSPQKIVFRNSTNWQLVDVTTEWQRISKTDTGNSVQIGLRDGYGISGIPDTATIYLWGVQAEAGTYPTSYIKTQGSSVTRNQDEYTKTGISDKINSEEGVLFLEVAALSLTSTLEILSLSDGTYNNVVLFRYYDTSSNDIQVQVKVAGSLQASMLFTLTDATSFNKIAIKYKENDFALWVNGVEVNTDSSGTTFTSSTLNKLSFDRGDGSNPLFSKVRQLQVFKTALSDSELATLTTL